MKKFLAIILTLGLAISAIACGSNDKSSSSLESSPTGETTQQEDTEEANLDTQETSNDNSSNEIVFWSLLGGADGELINAMIDEYNALDTGYTVKHYIQDWGEYYNKLSFSVLSGEAPDVAIAHVTRLAQLADQGVIKPLNEAEGSESIDWNDFINDVAQKAEVNGVAYAVPFDFHGFLLYYNTDILTQAGVLASPDEQLEIKSFDEFTGMLEKVSQLEVNTNSNKEDDIFPLALQTDGDVPYKVWYTFYLQCGGTPLLSDDGNELTLDDEASEKAIEALISLYTNGYAGVFNNQWEDFKAEKSAFVISLTSDLYAFNTALSDKMGVSAFPALFNNSKTFADSHSFILPVKESRDAEKEAAVLDFINWMVNSGKWMETGHFPTTETVFDSEEYNALPYVQNYKDAVYNLTYMSGSKNCWLLSPPKTLQNFDLIYSQRDSITPQEAASLIHEGLEADK